MNKWSVVKGPGLLYFRDLTSPKCSSRILMRHFDLSTDEWVVNEHFDLRYTPVELIEDKEPYFSERRYEPANVVEVPDWYVQVEFLCYVGNTRFFHSKSIEAPFTDNVRAIAFYSKETGMVYRLVEQSHGCGGVLTIRGTTSSLIVDGCL